MASHQLVQCVEEATGAQRSQHRAEQASQTEFGEQRDCPAVIAGDERAIAEH
jgi:hypothetical protein